MHPIRTFALATAAVSALALAGCTVHGTTGAAYGYSTYPSGYVVYDSSAPLYVESYPRYWYNGSYAYLVGDRWYVRYGGGWGYLSHEPSALYGYRAQRYRQYGFSSPPVYGRAPPAYGQSTPYVAPPAYGRPVPYGGPPAYGRPAPYGAPPVHGGGPPAYRPPSAPMPHVSPGPAPYAPRGAPPPTFRGGFPRPHHR